MDKTIFRLKFKNDNNGKKYNLEAISNSAAYAKELKGYLPDFYYLLS